MARRLVRHATRWFSVDETLTAATASNLSKPDGRQLAEGGRGNERPARSQVISLRKHSLTNNGIVPQCVFPGFGGGGGFLGGGWDRPHGKRARTWRLRRPPPPPPALTLEQPSRAAAARRGHLTTARTAR